MEHCSTALKFIFSVMSAKTKINLSAGVRGQLSDRYVINCDVTSGCLLVNNMGCFHNACILRPSSRDPGTIE